jgi:hypothetical protein
MGLLDELLGGGQLQKEYKDFVNRYEQGDPSQGYSDQEVLKRYGEVAHAVPQEHYAQAAQEALSKLSPEDLTALVKMLQDRAAVRGVTLPREVAPNQRNSAKCSPICMGSRGSCGTFSAVAPLSLSRKRLGQARLSTCCGLQWQRPCSRASRPWWSSASWLRPGRRSCANQPSRQVG